MGTVCDSGNAKEGLLPTHQGWDWSRSIHRVGLVGTGSRHDKLVRVESRIRLSLRTYVKSSMYAKRT